MTSQHNDGFCSKCGSWSECGCEAALTSKAPSLGPNIKSYAKDVTADKAPEVLLREIVEREHREMVGLYQELAYILESSEATIEEVRQYADEIVYWASMGRSAETPSEAKPKEESGTCKHRDIWVEGWLGAPGFWQCQDCGAMEDARKSPPSATDKEGGTP